MLRPIINPRLSLRARSLFYYFVEKGRVISADELWEKKEMPEGRDAIRSALSELKDANYIRSVRQQINGRWETHLKFTDAAKKMLSTDDGISGVMYRYTASSNITSTNIDTDTNVSVSIGAAPQEGITMGWNLDGDEVPKNTKAKVAAEMDAVPGSVGKVEDRQARLNAKYKSTKVETQSRDRINTPEELWSTNDLVAEFYDLVNKAAPNVPAQVNGKYVATWINKQVGEGTARVAILKAMRMFFEDPRLTANAGIGKPLWQRFFAYYPTVHGLVVKTETVYADDDIMAQQEKMLKLLEGN